MLTKKQVRRNPTRQTIHAETQASIAKEPKIVDCWKCGGTGQYLNFGFCFQCGGTGRMKAGAAPRANVLPLDVALQRLRRVYDATARPREATEHMSAQCGEGASDLFACMVAILSHGDVVSARRVFDAFSALPNGAYYAFHLTFGPTELPFWSQYPGNAQRLVLALAERSAPWTRDRKDKVIDVKRFGFND